MCVCVEQARAIGGFLEMVCLDAAARDHSTAERDHSAPERNVRAQADDGDPSREGEQSLDSRQLPLDAEARRGVFFRLSFVI